MLNANIEILDIYSEFIKQDNIVNKIDLITCCTSLLHKSDL